MLNINSTLAGCTPVSADTLRDTSVTTLQYRVRLPRDGRGNPPLLVLLHGYGSNADDLFALTADLPQHWLIVSAQGPLAAGNGGYKWYDVKQDAGGTIHIDRETEAASRKTVLAFIDEVIHAYHADSSRVIVGGFSQGATLALNISLTAPDKVAGMACFSGRFPDEIKPLVSTSPKVKTLRAFLAHGTGDQLLPLHLAAQSHIRLQQLGVDVTYSEANTGHAIAPSHLRDFKTWLHLF